jgi:hypothetical protein
MKISELLLEDIDSDLEEVAWKPDSVPQNMMKIDLGKYNEFDCFVKKFPDSNNQVNAWAQKITPKGKIIVKAVGATRKEATANIRLAVDQHLEKQQLEKAAQEEEYAKVSGNRPSQINFNVEFATELVTNPESTFAYIVEGPKLILSFGPEPGLKPIRDRFASAANPLYAFSMSGPDALAAGLIEHGRYYIKEANRLGNKQFYNLVFDSRVENINEKYRLRAPGLTVATPGAMTRKKPVVNTAVPGNPIKETATAGATSSANIASIPNPHISPGAARRNKSYTGAPGQSGTKSPPQPKVVQPKTKAGVAKNGIDLKGTSIFGGPAKRK